MLTEIGKRAKDAAAKLAVTSTEDKNRILLAMANALRENCDKILEANAIDIENGRKNNMSESLIDRLMLNKDRIEGMAKGIEDIIKLPDPVGRTLWETERPNGLKIQRERKEIGARTKRAMEEMALSKIHPSKAPYGYIRNQETGHLEIEPIEAQVIFSPSSRL